MDGYGWIMQTCRCIGAYGWICTYHKLFFDMDMDEYWIWMKSQFLSIIRMDLDNTYLIYVNLHYRWSMMA